jgi:hypothetical protein
MPLSTPTACDHDRNTCHVIVRLESDDSNRMYSTIVKMIYECNKLDCHGSYIQSIGRRRRIIVATHIFVIWVLDAHIGFAGAFKMLQIMIVATIFVVVEIDPTLNRTLR